MFIGGMGGMFIGIWGIFIGIEGIWGIEGIEGIEGIPIVAGVLDLNIVFVRCTMAALPPTIIMSFTSGGIFVFDLYFS